MTGKRNVVLIWPSHGMTYLLPVMSKRKVDTLKSLYNSVDDIVLYVGALGERPLEGTIIGPVFVCLAGEEINLLDFDVGIGSIMKKRVPTSQKVKIEVKLKRFHLDKVWLLEQLDEIRKVSLARVLCDNSDEIEKIQLFVMRIESPANPLIFCSSDKIRRASLSSWGQRGESEKGFEDLSTDEEEKKTYSV